MTSHGAADGWSSAYEEPPAPQERGSKKAAAGCVAFACLSLAALAACGIGLTLVAKAGLGLFTDQIGLAIRDDPVILEHIGTIERIELDATSSAEDPRPEVFVFDLTGSRGSGVLTAECVTADADTEELRWGRLELPSGESFSLPSARGAPPD